MKNALVDEAMRLASSDPAIVLINLCGDRDLFGKFSATHTSRLLEPDCDAGTAVGLAAGLAAAGMKPVVVASASDIGSGCGQPLRFLLGYHGLPSVIVGTEAGLSASSRGEAHLACQDIALMRTIPGMRVLAPADPMELRSCLRAALGEKGPTYLRIGTRGESAFFPERPTFSFGVWKQVRQGSRVTLLVTGNMMSCAMKAADLLEQTSLCPRICCCASIKPLDTAALLRYFTRDELVVTIEEHTRAGGFGSAVAEWLTDNLGRQHARLLRLGSEDEYLSPHQDRSHAREASNLSPSAIAATICSYLETHR